MKKFLALTLSALLVLALFASCGKEKDPVEPTTDAEVETTEDIPVAATEPETEEDETTEETTTVPEETTAEAATTTATEATTVAETTTKAASKPSGKAEIIAYVNEAMQRVRKDKPGYTYMDRTHIDDKNIKSSSGMISTIAPPIVRAAKGLWSNWSDPEVKPKGSSDHKDVIPKVDLQAAWVKSASCTESGSNYQIHIVLVDEHVPELPMDEKSTMHGKVMSAFNKAEIEDGVKKIPGVSINKFDCLYTGSYMDLTIDKNTGTVKKIISYTAEQATLEAKVGFSLDASIPLASERSFVF